MNTYIHEYKGFGIHPSACQVYIMEEEGGIWIGFQDGNIGTSVTNASEQIASEIVGKENLNPEICRFFEWYPQYEGEVSEISYQWNGKNASNAKWSYFCSSLENPFLDE
jgi:hypothetical protein